MLEKVLDGNVQAAVIGAVMRALATQPDAARVREPVLERAQQQAFATVPGQHRRI